MEETHKTFELNLDPYNIKGMVSSLTDEEIDQIENLGSEEYSEAVFNVSLISEPAVNSEIFSLNKQVIYIVGYKGEEGQIGYVNNNKFEPENTEDLLIRTISVRIFEVLMVKGNSGHFKSK